MKRLFIAVCALSAVACKKEMNECGIASQVRDIKTLDGKITLATETTWTSGTVVCGQQFQNYKIMEERGMNTQFTSYCPNGETIYYYRLRIVTQ